jgi:hypothetical protein
MKRSRCIILSLCPHLARRRRQPEFYLSYTTVEGEGDKEGEVDKD